jgi:hypothetical protein
VSLARLEAQKDQFSNREMRGRVKEFNTQIKPLREFSRALDRSLLTLRDATYSKDPATRRTLYSSAIANFVQAADPNVQLRYQMLMYFKSNVDSSLPGKWEVFKEKVLRGELPEKTMKAMLDHLENVRELTRTEFNAQRKGLVDRHVELDDELPKAEELFINMDDVGAKPEDRAGAPKGGLDMNAWLKANPPAGEKP